ncbi:MAG: hypothetical protein HY650_13225 [Acidobacteria bacterium]|nr:hypothetical protein [Acidobacteriota bacterium]
MMKFCHMDAQVLLGVCLVLGPILMVAAHPPECKWHFDRDEEGKSPAGFTFARTGQGGEGEWIVKREDSAPSKPDVLAQTSKDPTNNRYPLAIAEGAIYRDLALSVRFKTISGVVDQGAGLVFRFQDKDNYYVVRANALEDNLRLYHVVGGSRVQFAGANLKVEPKTWHEIRLEAQGNQFQCYYDGELKITARDSTFKNAGRTGLWTKADSVIYFDDLTVEDLTPASRVSAAPKSLAQELVDDLAGRQSTGAGKAKAFPVQRSIVPPRGWGGMYNCVDRKLKMEIPV